MNQVLPRTGRWLLAAVALLLLSACASAVPAADTADEASAARPAAGDAQVTVYHAPT